MVEQVSLYCKLSFAITFTFIQKTSQKKETTPKQTKPTMVKSEVKANGKNTKQSPELVSFCHCICY